MQEFQNFLGSLEHMGSGIYIAKQILQQFDGNLKVQSNSDIGTTVMFSMNVEPIEEPFKNPGKPDQN